MTRIRIGDPLAPDAVGEFEHFLTARFALWTKHLGVLTYTRAEHGRCPLQRAAVTEVDDSLVSASGLPSPQVDPIVHFSPGVSVQIGSPRPILRAKNWTGRT